MNKSDQIVEKLIDESGMRDIWDQFSEEQKSMVMKNVMDERISGDEYARYPIATSDGMIHFANAPWGTYVFLFLEHISIAASSFEKTNEGIMLVRKAAAIAERYDSSLEFSLRFYSSISTRVETGSDEQIRYLDKAMDIAIKTGKAEGLEGLFKRLTIDNEKSGFIDQAIVICEKAISLGLSDNTKGGFQGRLLKLQKKKDK